ncbi:MAG: hypothetical protein FRX49_08978 [Trebouxia sp. A1-2]|nr:MAG: hypothetical protein FRX49_08978 [Trebouxia sp. A1-2]
MENGVHVALVLLDLLFQVGQTPVAVMGHGDGAGDLALHIHLQRLSWRLRQEVNHSYDSSRGTNSMTVSHLSQFPEQLHNLIRRIASNQPDRWLVPDAKGSSAISLPPFLLASPDTAGPPAFNLFPVALLVLPSSQREIKGEGPDVQAIGFLGEGGGGYIRERRPAGRAQLLAGVWAVPPPSCWRRNLLDPDDAWGSQQKTIPNTAAMIPTVGEGLQ